VGLAVKVRGRCQKEWHLRGLCVWVLWQCGNIRSEVVWLGYESECCGSGQCWSGIGRSRVAF